jgi:glycosyltransferase involved in cell wall biosynthesis
LPDPHQSATNWQIVWLWRLLEMDFDSAMLRRKGVCKVGVFSLVSSGRSRLFGLARRKQKPEHSNKPQILFVSHEATRTGAPMIILNLLKYFHEFTEVECKTILHNGGHLAEDFAKYSSVHCLNLPRKDSDDLTRKVKKILMRSRQTPVIAICNSMESRHVAKELHRYGIPIIFLIHELPSSYTGEQYREVFDCSNQIIFPAHSVQKETGGKVSIPTHKARVLPQGLLNPQFATQCDPQVARDQLRQELKIPADAYVVLGCGTLDMRKGIDHFAAVARNTISQRLYTRPTHFVWVGEGPQWTHSTYHYVMLDVEKTEARDHVHFIGGRNNVEPYFLGSDAFLMTSRVDPFPCVIHEAMASGLPIIAFADSGGAPEALSDGAGLIVPYADYRAASNTIFTLMSQPHMADVIRNRAREKVGTEYNFANYAEQIIDITEATVVQRIRKNGDQPRLKIAA